MMGGAPRKKMRAVLRQLRESIKKAAEKGKQEIETAISKGRENKDLSPNTRAKLIDATFINVVRREYLKSEHGANGKMSIKEFKKVLNHVCNSQIFHVTRSQLD